MTLHKIITQQRVAKVRHSAFWRGFVLSSTLAGLSKALIGQEAYIRVDMKYWIPAYIVVPFAIFCLIAVAFSSILDREQD